MTIPSEAFRECKVCKEVKPITDFYLHSSKKYYVHTCKKCVIEKRRERMKGPEREDLLAHQRAWTKDYRARIKDEVFAAYGGYKCACCGETEPLFLTLDHIDSNGGEFRRKEFGIRTAAGYPTYQWLRRNDFPDGIQVLCMNCQHGKLMNNGICPHKGTCND